MSVFSSSNKANTPVHLSMAILVKDEDDIIENNIRVHAHYGVDSFLVMDNGSTDNTANVLEKLSKEYEITILYNPDPVRQQAKWMGQLVRLAKKKYSADWVLCNDADEFWLPHTASYKDTLRKGGSVIRYPRVNMMLSKALHDQGAPYHQSNYYARHRIDYNARHKLPDDPGISELSNAMQMIMTPVPAKVAVNPAGFLYLEKGNHRARHLTRLINEERRHDIRIYHYNFRSYENFEKRVLNRKRQKDNPRGELIYLERWNYWIKKFEQGNLREVYENYLLEDTEIEVLEKYELIARDDFPSRKIAEALKIPNSQLVT